MAVLKDLTDEILVEVVKFLACDKTTLHSLATVNEKLNGLATQILARDLDIYVQTKDQAFAQKYDLLMFSLDKRPDLKVCVRTITIRCKGIKGKRIQPKKDANSRANELLRSLPNIRSLCIDWEDNFVPDSLTHTEHPHLKEVTLLGWKTSLNEICDYMGVKSLSSIVVKNLDPGSKVSSQRMNPNSAGRDGANLTFMDLGLPHLPHSELRKIFDLASTLATLQCAMPGLEESAGPMQFRRLRTRMMSPLSPALMAQAFSPLQVCLVELRLSDGPITHWPGHDGTRMDISKFTCLKVLVVPSTCFFRGSPAAKRRGVRELLPPSLKELSLWFDFDNHLLYTDDELPQCFPDGQYSDRFQLQHSDRYAWLSELAEANIQDNSSLGLRKVMIQERVKHPRGFRYVRHYWELPLYLRKICASAELDLTVWLRKPKEPGSGLN